jgi:hypothetical protein
MNFDFITQRAGRQGRQLEPQGRSGRAPRSHLPYSLWPLPRPRRRCEDRRSVGGIRGANRRRSRTGNRKRCFEPGLRPRWPFIYTTANARRALSPEICVPPPPHNLWFGPIVMPDKPNRTIADGWRGSP